MAEEEARLRLERVQQEKEAALLAERESAEARARVVTEEAQRREAALNREREAAQQQAEQARREREAALQAERQQAEAEKRRFEEEAQQRLEQAQQEKEQALQAQSLEKEQALQAERQQAELARQEARQATHTGKQILQFSLMVGLALLLVFFLVMRARRKRLQGVEQEKQQIAHALDKAQADLSDASEREQLRTGAPDVFIEGVTPQNERIALKIPGASLVETVRRDGRQESGRIGVRHQSRTGLPPPFPPLAGVRSSHDRRPGFHERDRCKRRAPQSRRPASTGQRQPRADRPPGIHGADRSLNEPFIVVQFDISQPVGTELPGRSGYC